MEYRYLLAFILSFLTVLLVPVAFNYVVDPMHYFWSRGPSYYSTERDLKARLVEENKYAGLLMGSSKVAYIQPENIIGFDGNILNSAFSAALPEEMLTFLEKKNPEIEWLAVGLDWYMFNERAFPYKSVNDISFDRNLLDKFKYLVSSDTFSKSRKKLRYENIGFMSRYTSYGARAVSAEDIDKEGGKSYDHKKVLSLLQTNHYSGFLISERRVRDVIKISNWAKQKKVRLIIWFNPLHKSVITLLKSKLSTKQLMLPLRLKKSVDNLVEFNDSYQDDNMYWKSDPYHYYPSVGESFFNNVLYPKLFEK